MDSKQTGLFALVLALVGCTAPELKPVHAEKCSGFYETISADGETWRVPVDRQGSGRLRRVPVPRLEVHGDVYDPALVRYSRVFHE